MYFRLPGDEDTTDDAWRVRADTDGNFRIGLETTGAQLIMSATTADFQDNDITTTGSITGAVGTFSSYVGNAATGSIGVPGGTTAQRATPGTYNIRYNTTDATWEGYDGTFWGSIGGGPSADTDSNFRTHLRQTREDVVLWENDTTFTTDFATDANQIDMTGHRFVDGDLVYLETTAADLPAPLAIETKYYVVNATTDAVELSTTFGGSPVTLTDNGTGTHTMYQPVTSITGTMDVESDGSVTVKFGSEWIVV